MGTDLICITKVSKVSKVLGISRMTVWRWIKDGRFDVQRVGGVVFIPKREVELIKTKGGKTK